MSGVRCDSDLEMKIILRAGIFFLNKKNCIENPRGNAETALREIVGVRKTRFLLGRGNHYRIASFFNFLTTHRRN
jgi:hypothetical protein